MEPHQARLTLFAFLALSGVIVFNALYLQADPGYAARTRLPAAEMAVEQPLSSHDKKQNELIVGIRRELSVRDYFPGGLKGGEDAVLAGAIMAYQYDNGLPMTGRVSDELMKNFVFGVDKASANPGAANTSGETAERLMAEIQGIMSGEGFYRGRIDGRYGEQTAEAVRRFEEKYSLPVTGRISGLLVQELSRLTGMQFSKPRG